jgi:hypothetical protein
MVRAVSVELGPRARPCGCGCRGEVLERVYRRPNGELSQRRFPKYLPGHRPPSGNHAPLVPADPVRRVVIAYRERHGLTWAEMNLLMGYRVSGYGKGTINNLAYGRRPGMRRTTAERILRRLAGLSTPPSRVERELADRPVRWPERKTTADVQLEVERRTEAV